MGIKRGTIIQGIIQIYGGIELGKKAGRPRNAVKTHKVKITLMVNQIEKIDQLLKDTELYKNRAHFIERAVNNLIEVHENGGTVKEVV